MFSLVSMYPVTNCPYMCASLQIHIKNVKVTSMKHYLKVSILRINSAFTTCAVILTWHKYHSYFYAYSYYEFYKLHFFKYIVFI